ncbi:MAG: cytochrome c [Polyangia bacterium]|jgi:mono/diheme cytochrome c family protein
MKTILSAITAVILATGMSSIAHADGKEMFGKKCAGCHGKDGKAETSMGKKLHIKDLTDPKVQAAATDAQWEKIVIEGYQEDGKTVMPASKVSAAEAKELVKACRSLKK